MTIKQLRAALAQLSSSDDDKKVVIWLPGSRIDLEGYIMPVADKNGDLMIEGNVRAGSALDN